MARILLADDSRLSRRILAGALRAGGHDVREANDGAEALEAYRAERPDCLLTDLLMPNLDGFGLIEAVRCEDAGLPIVVASADIQQTSHDRCHALGVAALLTKPIKGEPLLAAVDGALTPTGTPSV